MQQKWEYRLHSMLDPQFAPEGSDTYGSWLDRMDDLGDEGWEAIGIVQELGGRTNAEQGLYALPMAVLMKRAKT